MMVVASHSNITSKERTMSTPTNSEYKAQLRRHAEELWALYLSTLRIDAKLAAHIHGLANNAYDLHFAFCQIEIQTENRIFHDKVEHFKRLKPYY